MQMELKVTGLDQLRMALQKAAENATQTVTDNLQQELDELKSDAQEIVPFDTGALSESAEVVVELDDSGVLTGTVTFSAEGGDGYDYAVRQHEDLELNHPNGREPKYLERPFLARREGLEERLFDGAFDGP